MTVPILMMRELQSDVCTLSPASIHVANMNEMLCCAHSSVHRHNTFEVVWLPKGRMTLYLDFRSYELEEGALMFIAPGQIHNWTCEPLDSEVLTFFFAADLFSMHGQDLRTVIDRLPIYDSSVPPILHIPLQFRDAFNFMFRTALDRLYTVDQGRERLLLSYLNVILAEAGCRTADSPGAIPFNAAVQLTHEFRMALEQDFADRRRVQDYAQMLGVTASHFVETVRQTTGYTPGYLIQERLMLEAKRLLVFTSLSTVEIAYRLSFKNPSQFGHWFREREALSPGTFRKTFTIP